MDHFAKHTDTSKDGPFYEANLVLWFCFTGWHILCCSSCSIKRSILCFSFCFNNMVHPLFSALLHKLLHTLSYYVVWYCFENQHTTHGRPSNVWSILRSKPKQQRMDHFMKQVSCHAFASQNGTSVFIRCAS